MNSFRAWRIILVWYLLVMLILSIAREWSVVIFGLSYGLLFGGLAYKYRKSVRTFFQKIRLNNTLGFFLIAILITVTEETYCYVLGNQTAHPVLWIDLVLVAAGWMAWFGTWYYYLSKKYRYTEQEALLTASITGILYEVVGNGKVFASPELLLTASVPIVIYAAIFVLPMQLIDFTGDNQSKMKYPVGVVLPYVLTIPVVVALYIGFSLIGIPLD